MFTLLLVLLYVGTTFAATSHQFGLDAIPRVDPDRGVRRKRSPEKYDDGFENSRKAQLLEAQKVQYMPQPSQHSMNPESFYTPPLSPQRVSSEYVKSMDDDELMEFAPKEEPPVKEEPLVKRGLQFGDTSISVAGPSSASVQPAVAPLPPQFAHLNRDSDSGLREGFQSSQQAPLPLQVAQLTRTSDSGSSSSSMVSHGIVDPLPPNFATAVFAETARHLYGDPAAPPPTPERISSAQIDALQPEDLMDFDISNLFPQQDDMEYHTSVSVSYKLNHVYQKASIKTLLICLFLVFSYFTFLTSRKLFFSSSLSTPLFQEEI